MWVCASCIVICPGCLSHGLVSCLRSVSHPVTAGDGKSVGCITKETCCTAKTKAGNAKHFWPRLPAFCRLQLLSHAWVCEATSQRKGTAVLWKHVGVISMFPQSGEEWKLLGFLFSEQKPFQVVSSNWMKAAKVNNVNIIFNVALCFFLWNCCTQINPCFGTASVPYTECESHSCLLDNLILCSQSITNIKLFLKKPGSPN